MKGMTGKKLKDWASRIPDDAIIEWPNEYVFRWEPMPYGMLRAVTLPIIVLLLMLSACTTMGAVQLKAKPHDWPPPTITQAELIQELGPPNSRAVTYKDGHTVTTLTWVYAEAEVNPALFIPIVGLFVSASGDGIHATSRSLAVTFDSAGKLTSSEWGQTALAQ